MNSQRALRRLARALRVASHVEKGSGGVGGLILRGAQERFFVCAALAGALGYSPNRAC
jgi:hypothetical protein